MEDLIKMLGVAFAGAVALFAVLLIARPVFDAFSSLSAISIVPTGLVAGLFLLAIGLGVFVKLTR